MTTFPRMAEPPKLLSPDSANNNGRGEVDMDGRILYSASRVAYVLDSQSAEELDGLPIHEPLDPQPPSQPLLGLQRVSRPAEGPALTRFRVSETPGRADEASPLLLCLPCKLSFPGPEHLRSHAAQAPHSLRLDADALRGVSAILQAASPSLAFLRPADSPSPPPPPEVSPEEVARNLFLASELSASRLLEQVSWPGGPFVTTPAAARNSCKTLKCPKCNWHYKYQETLEIHMKEKHPEAEVACAFCLHGQAHPKLARGETYGCGYKPYRCDICKYSTTTKGNLSIHMQSDKHLNNVQELQQGGALVDPSTLIHTKPPPSPAAPPTPGAGPSYRCEPCQYETPVSRNLRIHMTSDKHAHNMSLLARHLGRPDAVPSPAAPTSPSAQELLECGVCGAYACGDPEAMAAHAAEERPAPGPGDVSTLGGHHLCHLCQYKTHLKANFHLHTKTDKHLQRLSLVNHIREGGPENEWRLGLLGAGQSPVQVRCNACHELLTSCEALATHCASQRHGACLEAWTLVRSSPSDASFRCGACPGAEGITAAAISRHLESQGHQSALGPFLEASADAPLLALLTESAGDEEAAMGDAIHCCAWCNYTAGSEAEIDTHVGNAHGEGPAPACPLCSAFAAPSRAALETHLASDHNVPADSVRRLLALLPSAGPVPPDSTSDAPVKCQTCLAEFPSGGELSSHRLESGHVESSEAGFRCWAEGCGRPFPSVGAVQGHFRAAHPLPGATADACVSERHVYRFRCKECSLAFRTEDKLSKHSLYHQMRAATRCSLCYRNFRSLPALRRHVEAAHGATEGDAPEAPPAPSSSLGADKFLDPNRPFKCKTCRESFTQKNILVVHYNSVSHLHKAKKQYETGGAGIPMDPDVISAFANKDTFASRLDDAASGKASTSSPAKPYKCTLCDLSYSQSSTLDIHLRSVGHLSKLNKSVEGGGGGSGGGSAEEQQAAFLASLFTNPFLSQFPPFLQAPPAPAIFNCGACGSVFASEAALGAHRAGHCDGMPATDARPGAHLKRLLHNFGFDTVMAYNETTQQRRKRPAAEEEDAPTAKTPKAEPDSELGRRPCPECGKEYSSLWVLKAHQETAHAQSVSLGAIEAMGELLTDTSESPPVPESPKKAAPEPSEPPTARHKASRAEAAEAEAAAQRQMLEGVGMMNQMAAMFGAFNPAFMLPGFGQQGGFPNPFLPFGMPGGGDLGGMEELMKLAAGQNKRDQQNSAMAAAAAAAAAQQGQKRARTRITDDQLKILREYFDINNSPTEQQIEEMSGKSGLPLKVIKHWFRNTLFKERQRNKDSPYNFNIPPSLGIDLEEYEKTGETRVIQVSQDGQTTSVVSEPVVAVAALKTEVEEPVEEEPEKRLVIEEKPELPKPTITAPPPMTQSSETAATLSAQETLRRLTAMPPLTGLGGFPGNANPFSALLLAQSGGLGQLGAGGGSRGGGKNGEPLPPSQMSGMTEALSPMMGGGGGSQSGGSGRRANRTRFSDFQLKTLQEFFERQAYPKDDDLECLSKQLQLSPRVIVVWFQNARQKARKVYENSSAQSNSEAAERFTKTPGCNFQCKGCSLVFQRYYELIQHQQKHCFRDAASRSGLACERCPSTFADKFALEEHLKVHANNPALFDGNGTGGEGGSSEDGDWRSRTGTPAEARRPANPRSSGFNKRCPFCGILFYTAESMEGHLASRHAEQSAKTRVNIALLPDAEEVPTITSLAQDSPGESSNGLAQSLLSFGLLRASPSATESMDMLRKLSEGAGAPLDLTKAGEGPPSPQMSISMSGGGFSDGEDGDTSDRHGSPGSSRPPTKRYRTHLNPTQVSVMKHLFREYKTPSMSECDLLGASIGLHKRVVQVWFQNARAKGRKAKAAIGLDPKLEEFRANQAHCSICSIPYTPKHSLQDHIFTREHIEKVKKILSAGEAELKGTTAPRPTKSPKSETRATDPAAAFANPGANFLGGAGAGMGSVPGLGGMGGFFFDTALMGTPVAMLQIPADVMGRISAAMGAGREDRCRFTQDGKALAELPGSGLLPDRHVPLIQEKDINVGWGCRKCQTVFPSAELFGNHQRLVCMSRDPAFRLVQTHYHCRPCNLHFGRQVELEPHTRSAAHAAHCT